MRFLLLVLPAALVIAASVEGQTTRNVTLPMGSTSLLLSVGDAAHRDLRPSDALYAYREVLAGDADNYEALWRAARECISLGGLASSDDDRKAWFAAAEEYARQATRANSEGVDGNLWLAVAVGRRALSEGPRTRVRLAIEIREHALRTLALDSLNAGAHHVLGEWHAEIRRLSGITRWAARNFLGADVFDEASWEKAEHHLTLAVASEPDVATHHLDLARLYLDLDRPEEAAHHLRRVLAVPSTDPEDPIHRQRAEVLLNGR